MNFEKVVKTFQKAERKLSEEKGKLEAFMENLKTLGFDSEKKGKKQFKEWEKEINALEAEREKLINKFKKKYGKYLKSI